jgi:hypothetical protein
MHIRLLFQLQTSFEQYHKFFSKCLGAELRTVKKRKLAMHFPAAFCPSHHKNNQQTVTLTVFQLLAGTVKYFFNSSPQLIYQIHVNHHEILTDCMRNVLRRFIHIIFLFTFSYRLNLAGINY